MHIQPIETRYNGYRFRSRLEARWAVFFDTLSIEYLYEHEGYDIEGRWYLPDFYVPRWKCYIEIKSPDKADELVHFSELSNLFEAFVGKVSPIICFAGEPSQGWSGQLFCFDQSDNSAGNYQQQIGFGWCYRCGQATLSISDEDRTLLRGGRELQGAGYLPWNPPCMLGHREYHTVAEVLAAVETARSMRF